MATKTSNRNTNLLRTSASVLAAASLAASLGMGCGKEGINTIHTLHDYSGSPSAFEQFETNGISGTISSSSIIVERDRKYSFKTNLRIEAVSTRWKVVVDNTNLLDKVQVLTKEQADFLKSEAAKVVAAFDDYTNQWKYTFCYGEAGPVAYPKPKQK